MDLQLLSSLVFALFATSSLIWGLSPVADKLGLLDTPDHRKQHQGTVPLIGGVAIFFGIGLSSVLIFPFTFETLIWFLSSSIIVILGLFDDVKGLSAHLRLITQTLIALILSLGSGLYLENLGNLFGFGDVYLEFLGYIVTVVAVLSAINAFNMIDGIDGLLGAMTLVTFISLVILFSLSQNEYGLRLSLLIVVALLPYMASNLSLPPFKYKIFMGDTGSMLIGLSVVWLLIYGTQNTEVPQSFRPVTALWIIAIPLMDMVRITIHRIRKGQSPFKADRNHVHHILMDLGFTSRQTLLMISFISIILASIGILGELLFLPEVLMFVSFLLLFAIYSYLLKHK